MAHIHSKVISAAVLGHAQWKIYQDLRKAISWYTTEYKMKKKKTQKYG